MCADKAYIHKLRSEFYCNHQPVRIPFYIEDIPLVADIIVP